MNNSFLVIMLSLLAFNAQAADCEKILKQVQSRTYSSCKISIGGKASKEAVNFSISEQDGVTFSDGHTTQKARYYHFFIGFDGGGGMGLGGFTAGFDDRAAQSSMGMLGTPTKNVCSENTLTYTRVEKGALVSKGRMEISADGLGIKVNAGGTNKDDIQLYAECSTSKIEK